MPSRRDGGFSLCCCFSRRGGKSGEKGIKRGKGEEKGERGRKSQGIREKGEKDVVFSLSQLVARREGSSPSGEGCNPNEALYPYAAPDPTCRAIVGWGEAKAK